MQKLSLGEVMMMKFTCIAGLRGGYYFLWILPQSKSEKRGCNLSWQKSSMTFFLKGYQAFKWRRKEKPEFEQTTKHHPSNSSSDGGREEEEGRGCKARCCTDNVDAVAMTEPSSSGVDGWRRRGCGGDGQEEYQDEEEEVEEEEAIFDPEKHYARVLKEAKIHLHISTQTTREQTSWLQDASSYQLDAYKQVQNKSRQCPKSSKPWRCFLFWKRPLLYYQESAAFSKLRRSTLIGRGGTCTTKKVRHSHSENLNFAGNTRQSKLNSGPLYTDGLPCQPRNIRKLRKSHSGPVARVLQLASGQDFINISPYAPLHCRPSQSPLYYCH